MLEFETVPKSMFRQVMILDASGNLLEMFENYNNLYCLHDLYTNNRLNKEGPGTFHREGFVLSGSYYFRVDVNICEAFQAIAGNDAAAITALLTALIAT